MIQTTISKKTISWERDRERKGGERNRQREKEIYRVAAREGEGERDTREGDRASKTQERTRDRQADRQ